MKRSTIAGAAALAVVALVGTGATSAAADPGRSSRDRTIARATAHVKQHPGTFGYGADQALSVRDVIVDPDGTEHVRFDRTYKGLPVIGGDFVVHTARSGALAGHDHARARDIKIASTTPKLSARDTAGNALRSVTGLTADSSTPRLVVWALEGTPRIAWETTVAGTGAHGEPDSEVVVTDANTGEELERYDAEPNIAGTGNSEYTGSVSIETTQQADGTYTLKDGVRGHTTKDAHNVSSNSINASSGTLYSDADNVWGDGKKFSTDRSTAAVDAHANTAWTYDYYKNVHGRNGIKNDGKGATVFVHVGVNWDNAQWSDACFCMMTGDGNGTTDPEQVDLDTMGHEMTHGVTSATANLRYSGESGGLNEATSDIFGTMVEFYAGNAYDQGDYLFSDQSTPPWLRRMDKPSADGSSADCWSRSVKRLDVHNSSGVGNHWFYLASEGSGAKTLNGVSYNSPTCNASTVTGIGNTKVAKIWYRALTVYMTSTTDYAGARVASLKAATDLYGATSTEYKAVAAAWSAVAVN
ncbi:M4 family metallopeptidase [Longispora sp. K20-0274]|uniref:M4 family metallopeptidase n=1 Tax=Longispora sp. K20-0274 TaxID=3088255 RepID=UPI00399B17BB